MMVESGSTLYLLEKIAAANGVTVDDFLASRRHVAASNRSGWGRACGAVMLLSRICKAYFSLPGSESRLRAVRMMEAMAERARGDAAPEPAASRHSG